MRLKCDWERARVDSHIPTVPFPWCHPHASHATPTVPLPENADQSSPRCDSDPHAVCAARRNATPAGACNGQARWLFACSACGARSPWLGGLQFLQRQSGCWETPPPWLHREDRRLLFGWNLFQSYASAQWLVSQTYTTRSLTWMQTVEKICKQILYKTAILHSKPVE